MSHKPDDKRMHLAEQSDLSDLIQHRLRCKGDDGPIVPFPPKEDFTRANEIFEATMKRIAKEREEAYS